MTSGGSDALPDISGNTVTFEHADPFGTQQAYRYDYPGGSATVVDPEPTGNLRRQTRVGGSTFAFQDFGYNLDGSPEITGFDATTGVATRLTDDALYDRDPAVSQDGHVAVWTKCLSTADTQCHIWQATHGASGWSAPQQLTSSGSQARPDTDGTFVVYDTTPAGGLSGRNIAWQRAGGGPEHVLDRPGQLDQNPHISNGVVTFEEFESNAPTPNFEVMLYDIETDTLYQLTNTPQDEALNDVSLGADRAVTAVWSQVTDDGSDEVQVEQFRLPALPDTVTLTPATGSGQVGTGHTVTASVTGLGSAIAGVPVQFAVTGAVSTTTSCTTDATGACSITYQGPSAPGSDTITAYADTNGDGSRDNGEPQGTAAWTWEDTASTPGNAAGAGQIAGPHGRVSFLFGVHSDGGSPIGGCLVTDPGSGVTITCTDVTRYV